MKLLLLLLTSFPGSAFGDNAVHSSVDGKAIFEKVCSGCHGKEGIAPEQLREVFTSIPADLNTVAVEELHFAKWLSNEQVEALKNYLRSKPPKAEK